jgi:hypothetical protein
MNDPIVQEVRKYRDEHAKKFNYNLDAICSDLIARQQNSPNPVVSLKKTRQTADG